MTLQELVMLAMQASVMLTVFSFGLEASTADVLHVFRRPTLLGRSLVAMFVVMPVVAVLMVKLVHLPLAAQVALVALSVSPIPPLLPKKQRKGGGDSSYALGLMVTMALLSVLVIPVAMATLGKIFDRPFPVHPLIVAWIIVKAAVLPILAGLLFRAVLPELAQRLVRPVRLLGTVLLGLIALLILVESWHGIVAAAAQGTALAIGVFVLAGLIAGRLLGPPEPDNRVVLALSCASRHPGIAMALASTAVPEAHGVGVTILLYLVISTVLSLVFLRLRPRLLATS